MIDPLRLAIGVTLAAAGAAGALRARSLSASGALAAAAVGGAVFGIGGPMLGIGLLAFFLSSAALSRWQSAAKAVDGADYSQGSRRDARQVLANGVVPAAAAIAFGVSDAPVLAAAFFGALAAVTADTWATEVGLMAEVPPRMVTTGLSVKPGTSGAVTALGSAAAAAGAIFIGLVAAVCIGVTGYLADGVPDLTGLHFLILAPVAGLAGATLDSWLGATVQSLRRCPVCEKQTELERHSCGTITRHVRGWRWFTGDVVNLLCSLTGAMLGLVLELLIFT